MDLSNLKEILINGYKNFHNSIVNSSVFYFLKEKYDHLNPLYRKIIQIGGLLFLVFTLLYYPFSNLYSSWQNMRAFKEKSILSRDLVELSTASSFKLSGSYVVNQEPLRFIKQRIPTLRIPKEKIQEIKLGRPTSIPDNFSLPVQIKTVAVKIKDLTLKEVVQYGYQMEQMSKSIKLMNIHIKENPQKNNYFDVSYILSFFNLTKESLANKKQRSKKPERPTQENKSAREKPIIGNTKPKGLKKKEKTTIPSSLHSIKPKAGKKSIPLMELKNVPTDDTSFKNQDSSVKRKDLLPTLPLNKNKALILPPPPVKPLVKPPSPASSPDSSSAPPSPPLVQPPSPASSLEKIPAPPPINENIAPPSQEGSKNENIK